MTENLICFFPGISDEGIGKEARRDAVRVLAGKRSEAVAVFPSVRESKMRVKKYLT